MYEAPFLVQLSERTIKTKNAISVLNLFAALLGCDIRVSKCHTFNLDLFPLRVTCRLFLATNVSYKDVMNGVHLNLTSLYFILTKEIYTNPFERTRFRAQFLWRGDDRAIFILRDSMAAPNSTAGITITADSGSPVMFREN